MKKQTDPDLVGSWTFEAIRTFAGAATGREIAAMQNGRSAIWEALSKRIADAADRSARQAGEVPPTTDAA
ncbi:hypothetical protein [Methylocystis sp.]|uniref:hypothetical protein n=1 Tax=Methylocystis sp. TaxID=1911079 RepID=UPI003DA3FEAC